MASAQAMEEELQQSAMLSTDAEYETATAVAPQPGDSTSIGREMDGSGDDDELSEQDASGEDVDEVMDEDAGDETINRQIVVGSRRREDGDEDEDEDIAEDAEEEAAEDKECDEEDDEDDGGEDEEDDEEDGEDGEEDGDDLEDEEEEEDADIDDEEGVGAVKIKPGGSDDDAESEVSDIPSGADDDSDEDEEPAWEEAEGAEGEEESDIGPTNICMFCKQDEENDPSEDFETFLVCASCREGAHQQCARDAAAMSEGNDAKLWKCPECEHGDSHLEDVNGDGAGLNGDARSTSQQHSDELDQDALQNQNLMDVEESAVPADATVNGDASAAEGPRMLRKRKTSSVEPDEAVVSLRRRRINVSTDAGSVVDDVQGGGPSRGLRQKTTRPLPVSIERRSRSSLVLVMRVRPDNLREALVRKRRGTRRPGTGGRPPRSLAATPAGRVPRIAGEAPPPPPPPPPMVMTPFTTDLYSQPFYSFFDKESDDTKGKPYGGILTEAEADTSKTLPQPDDRRRFDQAKQRAEDEWRARILTMQAEADVPVRKTKKSNDNASQIECIEFGGWEIDTWYAAPYPAEYSRNRVLYICEFCLKYMNSDYVAWRHKLKCAAKHPPGDEIYRHGSVSVFEVDGRKNPVYCQNLCLLAKLFLGSKTLYYDVEPFLFYVLCEYDDCGYHFVGYFSKEKRASSQNNVSCILTLPIHQRKGYGNLLIDFSYLLTRVEEKTGSPEKPLSDMGLVSYRNYWRLRLCRYFLDVMDGEGGSDRVEGLSVRRISDDTGMTPDDVIAALEGLRALARDPQTKAYAFRIDLEYYRQYVAKWEAKGYVKLKAEALAWTPYVMGRSNAVNFELGPPINTMAAREEEARVDEGGGEEQDAAGEMKPVPSIEKMLPSDEAQQEPETNGVQETLEGREDWTAVYRTIPASRFEVFPPVTGRRGGQPMRSNVGPLTGARGPTGPRPKPKRAGGARRGVAARPRSTVGRKKTGGTGRGPGRWPKGTKKSDYGNADSGPGLPPGWVEKQARLKAEEDVVSRLATPQQA